MGPEICQIKDADVAGQWLLYSLSKGSVFCFGCKLFSASFQFPLTVTYKTTYKRPYAYLFDVSSFTLNPKWCQMPHFKVESWM